MNIDQFWQIIEATRADTQEEQLEAFRRELQQLTPRELIEFQRLFAELWFAAYSWDLWVVAWLCQGGMCSDDGFTDFRSWLISRGRATYEAAMEDADSLVDEMRQTEVARFESFSYVPHKTYEAMTGKEFPELGLRRPKAPAGGDWLRPELKDRRNSKMLNLCVVFDEMGDEEYEAIENRFPRTWELCVQKGIIQTGGTEAAPSTASTLPTPEEIAAMVDPNLAKTDFTAYLNALAAAARKAYNKDDNQNHE